MSNASATVQQQHTNIRQTQNSLPLQLLLFSLFYQNVRGLRTKSKQFFGNSSSVDYHIIVLTEIWLNHSHFSNEYLNKSYVVYRKDRCDTGSTLSLRGGVIIAVKSNLTSSDMKIPGADDIEYVCTKITLTQNSKLIVYAAYIPESDGLIYAKHSAAISKIPKSPNDIIINFVLGDFNIPNSNWLVDDDNENLLIPITVKPQNAADFIESVLTNGLHQINSIRNEDQRLLHLVFTNDYTNVELSSPPPLSKVDKQYHPPLLLSFELHMHSQ